MKGRPKVQLEKSFNSFLKRKTEMREILSFDENNACLDQSWVLGEGKEKKGGIAVLQLSVCVCQHSSG